MRSYWPFTIQRFLATQWPRISHGIDLVYPQQLDLNTIRSGGKDFVLYNTHIVSSTALCVSSSESFNHIESPRTFFIWQNDRVQFWISCCMVKIIIFRLQLVSLWQFAFAITINYNYYPRLTKCSFNNKLHQGINVYSTCEMKHADHLSCWKMLFAEIIMIMIKYHLLCSVCDHS